MKVRPKIPPPRSPAEIAARETARLAEELARDNPGIELSDVGKALHRANAERVAKRQPTIVRRATWEQHAEDDPAFIEFTQDLHDKLAGLEHFIAESFIRSPDWLAHVHQIVAALRVAMRDDGRQLGGLASKARSVLKESGVVVRRFDLLESRRLALDAIAGRARELSKDGAPERAIAVREIAATCLSAIRATQLAREVPHRSIEEEKGLIEAAVLGLDFDASPGRVAEAVLVRGLAALGSANPRAAVGGARKKAQRKRQRTKDKVR